MNQNMLFEAGLGLNSPWKVVRSGLEDGGGGSKFLYVDIEVEPGSWGIIAQVVFFVKGTSRGQTCDYRVIRAVYPLATWTKEAKFSVRR